MASFPAQSFSELVWPFSSSFWTVCLIWFSFFPSVLSPFVSSFSCSSVFSFSLDRFSPLLSFFSDSPSVFDSCHFFSSPQLFHPSVPSSPFPFSPSSPPLFPSASPPSFSSFFLQLFLPPNCSRHCGSCSRRSHSSQSSRSSQKFPPLHSHRHLPKQGTHL